MSDFDNNCFETPDDFFQRCHAEFKFTLDAAAETSTAKRPKFFTKKDNALSKVVKNQRIWLNPPYKDTRYPLEAWATWCASMAHMHNNTVVGLFTSSTDSNYWHKFFIQEAAEIRNIQGRIWFLANGVQQKQTRHLNSLIIWRPGIRGAFLSSMRARI